MSTIGYIQFMIWITIVLSISIFTLDLVCNLSQWAGCYKALYVDNKNVDVNLLNRKGKSIVAPKGLRIPTEHIDSKNSLDSSLHFEYISPVRILTRFKVILILLNLKN